MDNKIPPQIKTLLIFSVLGSLFGIVALYAVFLLDSSGRIWVDGLAAVGSSVYVLIYLIWHRKSLHQMKVEKNQPLQSFWQLSEVLGAIMIMFLAVFIPVLGVMFLMNLDRLTGLIGLVGRGNINLMISVLMFILALIGGISMLAYLITAKPTDQQK